ncbi:hypothetical protein Tco_0940757 [Tanacetum coccineum]|uniref:Uncharacterized protein n=1 Tax=Tanacetum coccineum TaxID=301880 RepID=A0ABQ5DR69_9ASTR
MEATKMMSLPKEDGKRRKPDIPVAIKPPSIATYKIIKQGKKGVYQIVREDGTDIVCKAMLDKKLQGGKPDEDCYKLLKWMEKKLEFRSNGDGRNNTWKQTALGKGLLKSLMADHFDKNCYGYQLSISSSYGSCKDKLQILYSVDDTYKKWMVHQLTKFHVQRVDMVINPPWNLPFLGAKGLTSPEQTATGKGISNPFMAIMVCQKPYGIPKLTNVSITKLRLDVLEFSTGRGGSTIVSTGPKRISDKRTKNEAKNDKTKHGMEKRGKSQRQINAKSQQKVKVKSTPERKVKQSNSKRKRKERNVKWATRTHLMGRVHKKRRKKSKNKKSKGIKQGTPKKVFTIYLHYDVFSLSADFDLREGSRRESNDITFRWKKEVSQIMDGRAMLKAGYEMVNMVDLGIEKWLIDFQTEADDNVVVKDFSTHDGFLNKLCTTRAVFRGSTSRQQVDDIPEDRPQIEEIALYFKIIKGAHLPWVTGKGIPILDLSYFDPTILWDKMDTSFGN